MSSLKFSEHIQWKMNNVRDPLMVSTSDKMLAPLWVDRMLGKNNYCDHIIGTTFDPIKAISLCIPPCLIKSNLLWNKMIFIWDQNYNKNEILQKIQNWKIKENVEWHYKFIKPGFIIEKIIIPPYDVVRVFVVKGKVKGFWLNGYILNNKKKIERVFSSFYNQDWKLYPVTWNKIPIKNFDKYKRLNEIKEVAEKLGNQFRDVRIDFIAKDNDLYFSEFTHTMGGGTHGFDPPSFNEVLGSWHQ
jgi:hypothetical protein